MRSSGEKTRVLLTGATGFVGSHALEALDTCPDVELVAAVRDPRRLLPGFKGEVRRGDLRDPRYVDAIVRDVQVVVHAGTWSSLFSHRQESRELFLKPALALIDAAVRQGVSRFINISTTSAAAPDCAEDPNSRGIPRYFWPHLTNIVRIENHMRNHSTWATTMVNLRCGIFVGQRYGLGVLPILLPRLRTHLVPWVGGGRTRLPLVDGRDIAQAIVHAVRQPQLAGYEGFNIVGPYSPTVRELIDFLHSEFGYPRPHFSVPFGAAYLFAWLMEKLDRVLPGDPLITRSIVHLLEETGATNERASAVLGYRPQHDWQESVRLQVAELHRRQRRPMALARPV
ncbi:MAG TPA: NAD(P)-dependent oxidoreductase [Gammaproteobacteria bacterium]|nr:NAD(P)-dependent oxidoreductase [Gammaproteobacteria bacterium]